MAKRISGPGISSGYFYQIRPGQALALLQLELQRKELQSFEQMAMSQLRKPLESYEEWVRLTLDPFGVQISQQHQLYDKVTGSSTKIRSDLMDKLAKRRNFLKTTVTRDSNLHLVKVTQP